MKTIVVAAVLGLLFAACSGGSSGPVSGKEGGACYPNGTCNAGLTCFSKLCVNTHPDGSADGSRDSSTVDVPKEDASHDGAGQGQAGAGGAGGAATNDGAAGMGGATTNDGSTDGATSETNADVSTSDAGVDAGPFDPSQLTGLALWLEGDKGVMLSDGGTYVAGWVDQSPAHHVGQAVEQPPVLNSGVIGTHPGIDMRGILMAMGGLDAGTGPLLIEMVVAEVVPAATLYSSTSTKASLGVSVSSGGQVSASESQPTKATVTAQTTTQILGDAHVVGTQIDGAGALSVRVDGALVNSQPGATYDLDVTGSYFGNAMFTEIVAVVGPITSTQVTALEGYLSTKYGL